MIVKFDDKAIDGLLKKLHDKKDVKAPESFTASVMDRIRDDTNKSVRSFDALFIKFSIGASIVAAASLLLAVNIFSSYTPGVAEYAAVDYLTVSIF